MAGTMHGARGGTLSWPLGVTGERQEKAGPVQRGLIAFAPVKVVSAFSSTLNRGPSSGVSFEHMGADGGGNSSRDGAVRR